jgi:hypothetical protein
LRRAGRLCEDAATVAKLYRRAPVDSPSFGRATFWVYEKQWIDEKQRARLDSLAEIEAALPPHRDYVAEVLVPDATVPGAIVAHKVDLLGLLERVPPEEAIPQLRESIFRHAEEMAARHPVLQWLDLREPDIFAENDEAKRRGKHWALVYMGDEPLHAERVPD